MHKSANAKLQTRSFGTVNSVRLDMRTTKTATLPTTDNAITVEILEVVEKRIIGFGN